MSEWIISQTGRQIIVYLFHTIYADLAPYEILCIEVCDFWQEWYEHFLFKMILDRQTNKHLYPELQIRRSTEDNSKIIFLIFQ